MVVQFEHNQTFDDRVKNSPVQGWFNGVRADLYVYPPQDNTMFDLNRFREYSSLQHPNIGHFCGYEHVGSYRVFGFETSRVGIENYVFKYSDFKHTRGILRKIVRALVFLHGMDFVHTALGQCRSYIFDQQRMSDYTSVKISVKDCYKIGSHGAGVHTKESNMEHLAQFLSVFFCGGQTTPLQAQIRPFRYLPCNFLNHNQTAYVHELRHFIRCLSNRVVELLNHPIFWTSERRLEFLQDINEFCNTLVQAARAANNNQDPVLVAAIKAINIGSEVGIQWRLLHDYVLEDLQFDGGRQGRTAYGLLLGIRHLKVHRLPVVGQSGVVIHGLEIYRRFDVDIIKGIDLYFSFHVPSFFVGVYNAAQRIIDVCVKSSFRKYLDLGFDPGNTELP